MKIPQICLSFRRHNSQTSPTELEVRVHGTRIFIQRFVSKEIRASVRVTSARRLVSGWWIVDLREEGGGEGNRMMELCIFHLWDVSAALDEPLQWGKVTSWRGRRSAWPLIQSSALTVSVMETAHVTSPLHDRVTFSDFAYFPSNPLTIAHWEELRALFFVVNAHEKKTVIKSWAGGFLWN